MEFKYELFFKIWGTVPVYIVLLFSCALFGFWLYPFLDNKNTVIIASIVYFIAIFYLYLVPWDTNGICYRMLAPSLTFLTVYFMEKRNLRQKIFLCFMYELIMWMISGLMVEVSYFTNDFEYSFEWVVSSVKAIIITFAIHQVLWSFLFVLLLYMSVRMLHKVYKRKYEELSKMELLLLLGPVVPLILVRPIIRSYYQLWMEGIGNGSIKENLHADIYRFLFYIASYAATLILIITYNTIKNIQAERVNNRLLEAQISDTKLHIRQVEGLYEKMKSIRHDMGNHFQILEQLIEKNKTKEASEYLNNMKKLEKETETKLKTGNPVTDIIISDFADKMYDNKILFETSYHYPESDKINAFDMSIILNNSLNNAYEAINMIDKENSKDCCFISVKSNQKDNIYLIEICNNFDGDILFDKEQNIPFTTKNSTDHGYGLRNIKEVAKKYYGDIDVELKENNGRKVFRLVVMMQV